MFDAINQPLNEGDLVVYSDTRYSTSCLVSGTVVGFTEKKIRIRTLRPQWQREKQGDYMDILKFPEQIAKVQNR